MIAVGKNVSSGRVQVDGCVDLRNAVRNLYVNGLIRRHLAIGKRTFSQERILPPPDDIEAEIFGYFPVANRYIRKPVGRVEAGYKHVPFVIGYNVISQETIVRIGIGIGIHASTSLLSGNTLL